MVDEAQPEDGEIVRELFTSMVESNSQVCSNAGEAPRPWLRCAAACSTRAPA